MFKVTKEITFDMGHRLSKYHGKCYNLHGHTYRLRVTVQRQDLDEFGFVLDFTDLKQILKEITDKIDHKTMLFREDRLNKLLVDFDGGISPDWFVMVDFEPTAENISKYLYFLIKEQLEQKITDFKLSIKLWETPTSFAVYEENA